VVDLARRLEPRTGGRTALEWLTDKRYGQPGYDNVSPSATIEGTLMDYRLGVDVGGTFTDVLLIETGSGDLTPPRCPRRRRTPPIGC
jgi:hypothetical protein